MIERTSHAGRGAIALREGRRFLAYRDSTGVWTIGVGHTGRMSGPPVAAGQRITSDQCDAFLAADLAPVEAAIRDAVRVPVSQDQFDALASLAFNIGVPRFRASTVVRRLNAGDTAGAADAFLMWVHPPELAARRKAERAQFLGGIAPSAIARPSSGPPSAPASVPRTATTETRMETIKMLLGSAQAFGALVPVLVSTGSHIARTLPDLEAQAKALVAGLENLWADARHLDLDAAEADIGRIVKAAESIFADVGIPQGVVAEVVAELPHIPSVAGLQAANSLLRRVGA